MAYISLNAKIATELLGITFDPGETAGGLPIPKSLRLPSFAEIPFALGTTAGKADLMGIAQGTLTPTTPGTTDIALVDLKAINDLNNVPQALVKAVAILVLNFSTTGQLLVGGAATNALVSPFNGSATAKRSIPAGWTDGTRIYPGGDLIWGGSVAAMAVDAGAKILKLDGGANTVPYLVAVLGRTA
jgi:hypothetical protein